MGKTVKKPKENLAPAYFVQYSALWCVLLGFFVMLLSLGNSQMGPGFEGLGEVKDAFGTNGGVGLMEFAKNVVFGRNNGSSSSFRIRQNSSNQPSGMDGYIRGLLKKQGLDISNIVLLETDDGMKVQIRVPIEFQVNGELTKESDTFITRISNVFIDLRQYKFEVIALYTSEEEDNETCQRIALLRSARVARSLKDKAKLTLDCVRAVGYSDSRFIEGYGTEPVSECVIITIQQGK